MLRVKKIIEYTSKTNYCDRLQEIIISEVFCQVYRIVSLAHRQSLFKYVSRHAEIMRYFIGKIPYTSRRNSRYGLTNVRT